MTKAKKKRIKAAFKEYERIDIIQKETIAARNQQIKNLQGWLNYWRDLYIKRKWWQVWKNK